VDVLPPTTPEQHWGRLRYFLENLCPVAEKYGMKLCAHPDDPPIEYLKGTFRPLTSVEGMRKLLALVDSPANCLEFCQGTISTMRGIDIYAAIEEFASAGRIGYVHFRNTSGTLPRYSEVFIDDGYVDMKRAMAIYEKCGFEGTIVPDHSPRLDASDWWETGMAFALGYMRGIMK
jgi:mannonate dehydratase